MGTPIKPIPILPGDQCTKYWGSGSVIGSEAPSNCSVTFNGWTEGDLWDERYRSQLSTPRELLQDPVNPCLFTGQSVDLTWSIYFYACGTYAAILPIAPLIGICFIGNHSMQCKIALTNNVTDIPQAIVYGGKFQVSFGGAFPWPIMVQTNIQQSTVK